MAITKINTPELFDLGAANSALRLPSGGTASRPSSPSTGEWRYNTDDNKVEYWDGSAWFQIDDEALPPDTVVPGEHFSPNTYTGNGGTNALSSKIGNAGYFNGSSSKIDVSNPPQTNSGEISISFWAKSSSTSREVFFIFEAPNPNIEFLKLENNGYQGTNSLRVSYNNAFLANINNQSLTDGNWHHIVVTVGNGNVITYKDGNPIATQPVTIITPTINDFALGYRKYNNDLYFNGGIDQVRIFNTELNSTQVGELYLENSYSATTKSTTDFFGNGTGVALYQLDGNSNDTGRGAIDSGQSAVFNKSSSYIQLASSTAINKANNFTWSAWVNFNSLTNYDCLIALYSTYINTLSIMADGRIRLYEGAEIFSSSGVVTTNTWYHIAWTKSSTSGSKIYLNGSPIKEDTRTTNSPSGSGLNLFGASASGSTPSFLLDGKLDQIRIYSTALGPSDIEALASETNVPTSNLSAHYKLDGNGNDETTNYNATLVSNITYSDPAQFPTYNGTDIDVGYQGTAFQPDLVWTKTRNQPYNHSLYDSVRGVNQLLQSNTTIDEFSATNALNSFDSNGFTLGANDNSNTNGESSVAWCWKAGGNANTYNIDGTGYSTLSAAGLDGGSISSSNYVGASINSAAGFGTYKYISDGGTTVTTMSHGLPDTPKLIITKGLDTNGALWGVYSEGTGNRRYLQLSESDAQSNLTTYDLFNSDTSNIGIRQGTFAINNENCICYAFCDIDGYQKIGSYTGTGTTPQTINVGFAPRWVIIKNVNNASGAWRIYDTVRGDDTYLRANTADIEAVQSSLEFETNGFTLTDNRSDTNELGSTHIYLTIA